MAMDALVVRIARLEGGYEQIDKRLGSLEGRMASLERKMDDGFRSLHEKIDVNSRWLIGLFLVNWVTVIIAVPFHR